MVKMGTVWDRTAEFLADNLSAIVPIALIAYFVPYSITGSFEPARAGAAFELQLILQLVSLAFAALATWGSLTLAAMVLAGDGRSPGAIGGRRLLPALVVKVALGLGCVLLFAPAIVALAASGIDLAAIQAGTPPDFTPATAATIGLNALIALPLLLWLSARLALVDPVIVGENRMLGAVARSWRLTRGLTLRILGVVILYVVVSVVAALATKFVFGSVYQLIAGPSEGLSLSGVLTSITVAAVQTGVAVIAPLFTANLLLAVAPEPATAA